MRISECGLRNEGDNVMSMANPQSELRNPKSHLPRILEPEVMDTLEVALAYETMDHSGPNAAVVGRLTELGARGRMLDLGTGPGHVPIAICERFSDAMVVGIDLSVEMLKIAQRHRLNSL